MKRQSSSSVRLRLEALEERCTPSASNLFTPDIAPANSGIVRALADHGAGHELAFQESLTLVSATSKGVFTYVGDASYFGHVTAVVLPDNTFVKTASNGDAAFGTVTHQTATTGTLQFTGGTGQFADIRGTESYVISTDATTGVTTVAITGTVTFGPGGRQGEPNGVHKGELSHDGSIPVLFTGGGTAPDGLPVFPGGTGPHNATGWASLVGNYTGNDGNFMLLSFDPATGTGTFTGSFVFVAANGDRLAMKYGADPNNPGTFTLVPAGDGKVQVVFVAEFTPDPANSTGRFKDVTGGGFTMVATTEPFVLVPNAQGYTVPFAYTWVGEGTLRVSNGKR
jgi:hypothetical protein